MNNLKLRDAIVLILHHIDDIREGIQDGDSNYALKGLKDIEEVANDLKSLLPYNLTDEDVDVLRSRARLEQLSKLLERIPILDPFSEQIGNERIYFFSLANAALSGNIEAIKLMSREEYMANKHKDIAEWYSLMKDLRI